MVKSIYQKFLCLLCLGCVLCGCNKQRDPSAGTDQALIEEELARQARSIFLALANDDKAYLKAYRHLDLAQALNSPMQVHDIKILQVQESAEGGWTVDYRLQVSDAATTAFNYLVRDESLTSPHALAVYATTVHELGRLVWQPREERLVLQDPAAHSPIGRIRAHAIQRKQWQQTLPSEARGLISSVDVLRLLKVLEAEQALAIRGDEVVPALVEKLAEAESRGPMDVLATPFLLSGQDRLSRAVLAVAALADVLDAWSTGDLAARYSSLVELNGKSVPATLFEQTPVRLIDYSITGVDMREPHVFSVAAELTVSDPASVLGVTMCAGELASPLEQLEAIDSGVRVRDAFYVARRNGTAWNLHYHRNQGSLGYAIGTARALKRFRSQYRSPIALMTAADSSSWARELNTRFNLLQNEMADLDFGPVARMLTASSNHGYLSEVVKKLVAITSEIRSLQTEPPRVLAFVLGSKMAEYFITAEMLAHAGKPQPEAMASLRAEIVRYLRALAVRPELAERIDDLLTRHSGTSSGSLRDISAEIRRHLQRTYEPKHAATYLVGFNMLHLVILSSYQDQLTKFDGSSGLINPGSARQVLGDLEYNMEFAGARKRALDVVRNWNYQTGELTIPSSTDTAPLKSFDWFFDREPQIVPPDQGPSDGILE